MKKKRKIYFLNMTVTDAGVSVSVPKDYIEYDVWRYDFDLA
jgi:hypothetical protein